MFNHDPAALRRAFANIPSGVVAICASPPNAEPIGMVASTFVPVSLDPPLVAFCVQNGSATWPRLREHARLGISVLGDAHDGAARVLSSKDGDRFQGIDTVAHPDGALFVSDCALRLDVSLEQEVPAGDHVIAVLRINEINNGESAPMAEVDPLVFHRSRFRKMLAPA